MSGIDRDKDAYNEGRSAAMRGEALNQYHSLATDAVPSSGRVFSSVISTLFETCAGQRRRHGINEAVHQH